MTLKARTRVYPAFNKCIYSSYKINGCIIIIERVCVTPGSKPVALPLLVTLRLYFPFVVIQLCLLIVCVCVCVCMCVTCYMYIFVLQRHDECRYIQYIHYECVIYCVNYS